MIRNNNESNLYDDEDYESLADFLMPNRDDLLETTKKIAEEYKAKYLNLLTEYDKLKNKQKAEYCNSDKNNFIITELLPLVDDIGFAMKSGDYGFKVIYKKFLKMLNRNGYFEFGQIGEKFDTSLHNAIHYDENGYGDKIIVDVIRQGFRFNNKIIRYADVFVGHKKIEREIIIF